MIIPMKKAHLVVLKEDKEKLLKSLQRYGELMITSTSDDSPLTTQEDNMLNRTNQSLKLLAKYREKKPLFGDYNVVEYNDFINKKEESLKLVDEVEEAEVIINNLTNDNKSLQEEIKSLLPWKSLEVKPCELSLSKMAVIHCGYLESRYIEAFTHLMDEYNNIYHIYDKSKMGFAIYFINYYEEDLEIIERLRSFNYSEATFPQTDKYINDYLDDLNKKLEDNNLIIKENQDKLLEYSKSITDVQILNDQYLNDKVIKEVKYQRTDETIYIEGWVRSDRLERFEKSIQKATDIYDLELTDPSSDDVVPTFTKNKRFITPFESITDMFSKPQSDEIDPNPAMAIWYWILFGMMMADAGYGLLMMIGVIVLKKLLKPVGKAANLYNIILYSSITTIIWGILFGSYFGFTIPGVWFWFSPMEEPIMMLIVSVAIGGAHIITGLIIKAISNFKDKQYLDILSDQLSWILILCGIAMFFINSLQFVGIISAIVGVALIILFHGRKKKGVIGKVAFGVLGLYDITSYMSDLLSYSRIMALALSSASVAMVMNQLASMVQGGVFGTLFSILIYIVGHVFNLVLGLLSAYVHDSRLQYIEFFGKFFEGGGVDFRPLTIQSKYINVIKDEQKEI